MLLGSCCMHANTCSFLNQPKVIFLVPLTGALGTERERHCCFINSFMLAQLDSVQGFHSIITMHFSLFPLLLHHVPLQESRCLSSTYLFLLLNVTLLKASFFLPCRSPPSVTESQHSQNSCSPRHQVHRASRESHFESKFSVRGVTPATAQGIWSRTRRGAQLF